MLLAVLEVLGQSHVAALERHIHAQGMCVWYLGGGMCCSIAACALEGLALYREGSVAGDQNHPAGM